MSNEQRDTHTKSVEGDATTDPKHFSREPWWMVPVGGLIAALLPLAKYQHFQRRLPGIGLREAMLTAGCLGAAAAAVLVVRSHVRSIFWSNVVLWVGILLVTIGVCILSVMLPS